MDNVKGLDTKGGKARRSSPKGQLARQTILSSATRLFSEGGFNSVSLADIAKNVGMTQAGLLHHFPTKSALLLAVLMEREVRNQADTRAEREKGHDGTQVFLHTLRKNDRNPALVQLMALLSAEAIPDSHPAHDWFEERHRQIVELMVNNIEEVVDRELLPKGLTIETLARWVIGLADGLRLQWLYDQDALSREKSLALFYDIALRPYIRSSFRET